MVISSNIVIMIISLIIINNKISFVAYENNENIFDPISI